MGWSACFRKCTRCLGSRGGDADGWSASASTLYIPLQSHSSKALPRFLGDVSTCVVGAKNWQLGRLTHRRIQFAFFVIRQGLDVHGFQRLFTGIHPVDISLFPYHGRLLPPRSEPPRWV